MDSRPFHKYAILVLATPLALSLLSCRPYFTRTEIRHLNLDEPEPIVVELEELQDAIVRLISSDHSGGIHAMLHSDLGGMGLESQFEQGLEYVRFHSGGLNSVAVAEAMELHLPDSKNRDASGLYRCAPVDSKYLHEKVLLSSPTTGIVYVVLSEADYENGGYPAWLSFVAKRDGDALKIAGLYVGLRESGGHDADWFADRSLEFQRQKQTQNAYLFRETAMNLMLSPYLRPMRFQELALGQPSRPPAGLPRPGLREAEIWSSSLGKKFTVSDVSMVAATGFYGLEVRYLSDESDPTTERAAKERELLFEYFSSTYPEYESAFDGAFIGTMTKSGQGFREYFEFAPNSESVS